MFALLISTSACNHTPKTSPLLRSLHKIDSVGFGLLQINSASAIPLYLSEKDTIPFDTLIINKLTTGKHKGSFAFHTTLLKDAFQPYKINEFPGEPVFRVGAYEDSAIQIIINDKENATCLIHRQKNDTLFKYRIETWQGYLSRVELIEVPDNLPIFDKPNGKRIVLMDNSGNNYFKVLTVDGDWLALIDREYNYPNHNKDIEGWIKWRDKSKILITILPKLNQ